MKIQYVSDLHLEFPNNREYIKNNPIIPSADILLIAGDLGYLNLRRRKHIYEKYCDAFLDYCSKNWKHTILIPGNHEFYGGAPWMSTPSKYNIADNVTFINNDTIKFDEYNLTIFGATLWSNVPQKEKYFISARMNDYRLINYVGKRKISIGDTIVEHEKTVYKIENLKKDNKLIIVTHHGCHPQCIDKKYNGSLLNSAYYTDLSSVIDKVQPDVWIFGHTHHTQKFKYNNTIIAENSLGYIDYGETYHFEHSGSLEM